MKFFFKIIFLKVFFLISFFSNYTFADNHNIYEIMEQLQKDIKTLEKAVYSGSIKYDSEIPSKDIARFCEYVNISSTKFSETVDQHRNKEIWKKTANGWDLKNQISNKIIDEN